MARFLTLVLVGFLLLCSLPAIAFAQEQEDPATFFYNGLAEIIENNIERPSRCMPEANRFFSENRELLDQWNATVEGSGRHAEMDPSELEGIAQEPGTGEALQAKERFKQAYMQLSAQDPRGVERLKRTISRFAPQIVLE